LGNHTRTVPSVDSRKTLYMKNVGALKESPLWSLVEKFFFLFCGFLVAV
jgi:hypothetical protein